MQQLSQSLETLSVRVKKLEDSATAAFEADRARLEHRRREIDAALTADRDEFESPIRELRARHEERQSDHEFRKAMRTADAAEEDAAVAIEIATHWLNIAEYAVIDATLARMAADDLAMAAERFTGSNEPIKVAGGVS